MGYRSDKLRDNADWAAIEACRMFYATIPPMEDMPILWGRIRSHKPIVLTGIPRIPGCAMQKRAWIATYLGEDVPVITCRSAEKCLYAQPGDILIDDWEKYRHLWEAKGGEWITHRSAAETIKALSEMGFGIPAERRLDRDELSWPAPAAFSGNGASRRQAAPMAARYRRRSRSQA